MTNYIMFTEPGRFIIGCNYWASHAGTAMWSDWRSEVVDEDLRKLTAAGLQVLRVFPRGVVHDLAPDQRVVVAINYSPAPLRAELSGQNGWTFLRTLHGQARLSLATASRDLPANDAVVLEIRQDAYRRG